MGTPALAGAVGTGVGCVYLGIPQTHLVDEAPLVVGGAAGAVSGMAFSRALAAGAATREGKVMSLVGLAGLGAFGLSVKDLSGPTAFYK